MYTTCINTAYVTWLAIYITVVVVAVVNAVLRQWPGVHRATRSRAWVTWRWCRPIGVYTPVHRRWRSRCFRWARTSFKYPAFCAILHAGPEKPSL